MVDVAKRVNIRIPARLYIKIEESEMTVTEAIVQGLELLFKEEEFGIKDILELKDEQIRELQEQLRIKDNQIDKLNGNIHELSDTMKAQAVHLQTVLTQKAIEEPRAKKLWWRFW